MSTVMEDDKATPTDHTSEAESGAASAGSDVVALAKSSAAHFGRGILMGGADIIPGVSGGTVALIVGIYDRLVRAVSRVDGTLIRMILRLDVVGAAKYLDLMLLIPLVLGIGVGILSLSGVIEYLLTDQREPTFATFFGLIVGSAVLVGRMVTAWTWSRAGIAAAAAVTAFVLVGLPFLSDPPSHPAYLFVCGAIAITAMILPGISGSYLLLVLGAYGTVLEMLNGIRAGDVTGSAIASLAAFGAGIVVGILSFSKLLRWLLEHYYAVTMAALTGLMIGSLRRLWPFQVDLTPDIEKLGHKRYELVMPEFGDATTWIALGGAIAGFAVILLLDRFANRQSASIESK
ncbi:DUF368 domain-containing protein [Stratiformator vulcanicus]|uniref:DUF368 domain-containing protein n=1 Tax=Stratiformator vulcanicus TaxID=2527980 RepID=UPI0028778BA0|nr:DUF368 domain-containing protein [Stratiformator vulcanicus]